MNEVDQWEKHCPQCGGANQCAMANGGALDDCWCRDAKLSKQALAAIPPESAGRRCLCPACGRSGEESTCER